MLIVRDMEFSPKRPRVIVPLFARNLAALSAQTAAAEASPVAELAELRLDPLPREAYTNALCAVRAALHKPLIVTLRTAAEGGEAPFTADAYRDACLQLLQTGGMDFLDIEWLPAAAHRAVLLAAAQQNNVRVIFSEHHFDSTPATAAMTETLLAMQRAGADIAKLAVMPRTAADAARLLQATAAAADACPGGHFLTMSMGKLGEITRFCGGAFGSYATFGTLGTASAPGQPAAAALYDWLEKQK